MKRFTWLLVPALLLISTLTLMAQDADKEKPATEEKPTTKEGDAKEGEAEAKPDAEAEPDKATLDKKAPAFKLKNASGKEVSLSDYKDKIVVLEWINFDCPWCKKHYEDSDDLVKMQKEMRDDGVVWLLICSSAEGKQGHFDADTLKKRMEKVDVKADFYLHDTDGVVGKKYEAATTPHCYVIDKEGKLRYRGAIDNMRQRMKDKTLEEVNYVKLAVNALKDGKAPAETDVKPYG